jgi:co-chaperonin GroES (HSP10)
MERKLEVKDLSSEITPTLNRVFVKLIKESDEYFSGLKKTDANTAVEPYVLVLKVGESVKSTQAGDYALTRMNMTFDAFKMGNDNYSIINEHDIIAVISKEVATHMSNERISQAGRKELNIVN